MTKYYFEDRPPRPGLSTRPDGPGPKPLPDPSPDKPVQDPPHPIDPEKPRKDPQPFDPEKPVDPGPYDPDPTPGDPPIDPADEPVLYQLYQDYRESWLQHKAVAHSRVLCLLRPGILMYAFPALVDLSSRDEAGAVTPCVSDI